jgi:hypothetical protein
VTDPPPFDPDVTLIGNREGNQREVRIYQHDAQRQTLDLDAIKARNRPCPRCELEERTEACICRGHDPRFDVWKLIEEVESLRATRPGPDEVTVSREALATLLAPYEDTTPLGSYTRTRRKLEAIDALRAALSPTPDTKETGQ